MIIRHGMCNFRVLLFLSILALFAGCGGGGGGGGSDTSYNHNEMLNSLDVPTDQEKKADDYNPTLRKRTVLYKNNEILLAGTQGQNADVGWTQNGSKYHAILDCLRDEMTFRPENMKYISTQDSWLAMPKAMASGDMDGDGKDEIFIAYLNNSQTLAGGKDLAFRVIKNNGSSYEDLSGEQIMNVYAGTDITEYTPGLPGQNHNDARYWYMANFSAACGDLNGDGVNEWMVAFNRQIYIISYSSGEFNVSSPASLSYPKNGTDLKLLRIAAGDLDNNGTDELVVMESDINRDHADFGQACFHIYTYRNSAFVDLMDTNPNDETPVRPSANNITASGYTLHAANIAVGDLDNDGQNEILFVGSRNISMTVEQLYFVMYLEPELKNGTFVDSDMMYVRNTGLRGWTNIIPICAIADFDGDRQNEVLAYRYMYDFEGGALVAKNLDIYTNNGAGIYGSAWDCSLAVGDIDGKKGETWTSGAEIVFISDGFYEMYCMGFNSAGAWVRKGSGDIADTGNYYPAVTMGDYDGDSLVVEFQRNELLYSDPHPIAVLAASPFYSGMGISSGSTSLAKTTEQSYQDATSYGVKAGISFGYESEGLFDLWDVSFKTTFESSFNTTVARTSTFSQTVGWSTAYNEDMVIFTVIPYDVYYYKVLEAPPDSGVEVGANFHVSIPRKPVTLYHERDYYNDHNGDAPDITPPHTIGNPLSYPDEATAITLISDSVDGGVMSSSLNVGSGSGTRTVSLDITHGESQTKDWDLAVTVEAEFGTGGAKAGVTGGYHYGESYTVETSKATSYSAEVSSIPTAYWSPTKTFHWGLFFYSAQLQTTQEKYVMAQFYTGEGSVVESSGL
jgi:hypothetical protein